MHTARASVRRELTVACTRDASMFVTCSRRLLWHLIEIIKNVLLKCGFQCLHHATRSFSITYRLCAGLAYLGGVRHGGGVDFDVAVQHSGVEVGPDFVCGMSA